jgi:hypothetical protein
MLYGRVRFPASSYAEREESSLLQMAIADFSAESEAAPKNQMDMPKHAHLNRMDCGLRTARCSPE